MRSILFLSLRRAEKKGLSASFTHLITGFLAVVGLMAASPLAAQVVVSPIDCAGTINPNLACNSNDIKINSVSQMTEADGGQAPIETCNEGELGYVDISLTTQLNATGRYDVITWFGIEGNDPRGATLGNCYASSLPDDPESIYILDLDGDACLDVNSSPDPVTQNMYQVPFTCIDVSSLDVDGNVVAVPDGEADVFALVTWFQNNTLVCGEGSAQPGLNPKCDISLLLGLNIQIITNPGVQIVKTPATQQVNPGETANFTLTVTNVGDVELETVNVTDAECDAAPTLDSGDVGSDGILGLDETWIYSCSTANVQAGFNNIANVTAEEVGTGIEVSDFDSAVVTISAPGIEIIKTPDQTVNPGGTASFTMIVSNVGDTDLENVVVTDVDCDVAPTLDSGDTGSDGVLPADGSENWVYTCSTSNVIAGFVNTSNVVADPVGEGDSVNDSDTATVTLSSPAVQIVKTPDQSVNPGGTAAFTLTVTNPGDVSLDSVVVTDAMCDNSPVLQSGDVGVDGILTTTETWIYICSTANVLVAFTNTGNVVANPVGGGNAVNDSDTAAVTLNAPSITVVKNPATQAVSPGGTASFDVDLENVVLSDALTASCDTNIGNLASGASTAAILCDSTNVQAAFINQADVTGDPVGGGNAVNDMSL
jgi:uncharacterized repeat protein (TIGR01451 family)